MGSAVLHSHPVTQLSSIQQAKGVFFPFSNISKEVRSFHCGAQRRGLRSGATEILFEMRLIQS